jgi:hypothetical protein
VAPPPSAKVRVPTAEADQPKLVQVGIIAVLCFAIGMVWPTLWGASLVPSVPSQDGDDKPKAKPKPDRPAGPEDPAKEVPAIALAPNTESLNNSVTSATARAEVQKTLVVNCRDERDRRVETCDTPGFDSHAQSRLQSLVTCPAVQNKAGLLSIGFELDFSKEKITQISAGKSSTLDDTTVEALLDCAKREFMSATLRDVAHTHARYLVFYTVQFTPAGAAPQLGAAPAPSVVSASGSATVIWNSARVRSLPDAGDVRERLLYGTRVVVTGRQGDWYRVRYDAKGNEGWVHKNALAM